MKTKSSLLGATAGTLTVAALALYSSPAAEFTNVTVTVPANWSMLAIPVVRPNYTLEVVLPPRIVVCSGSYDANGPVPIDTAAFRLTSTNFVVPEALTSDVLVASGCFSASAVPPFEEYWFTFDGLAACSETVDFGSGILLLTPWSFSITWTGEVAQAVSAVVSNHIPAGLSIKSSKSLLAGRIQSDLGLPVLPGDVLQKYNVVTKRMDRYTSNPSGSGQPSDWIGPSSTPGG
jgi:hypothetical protein